MDAPPSEERDTRCQEEEEGEEGAEGEGASETNSVANRPPLVSVSPTPANRRVASPVPRLAGSSTP